MKMCCDEDNMLGTRKAVTTATMTAETKKTNRLSLLVDYTKNRADTTVDTTFGGKLLLGKPFLNTNSPSEVRRGIRRVEQDMQAVLKESSDHDYVLDHRRRSRHHMSSLKEDEEAMGDTDMDESDDQSVSSEASFGLDEVLPIPALHRSASANHSSFGDLQKSKNNQRAELLAAWRQHQSLSNLQFDPKKDDHNLLSFSLRTRSSATNLTKSALGGGCSDHRKGGMTRTRTYDERCSTSSTERFHHSFSETDFYSSNAAAEGKKQSPNLSPPQDRRARLLRHSSVSCLMSTETTECDMPTLNTSATKVTPATPNGRLSMLQRGSSTRHISTNNKPPTIITTDSKRRSHVSTTTRDPLSRASDHQVLLASRRSYAMATSRRSSSRRLMEDTSDQAHSLLTRSSRRQHHQQNLQQKQHEALRNLHVDCKNARRSSLLGSESSHNNSLSRTGSSSRNLLASTRSASCRNLTMSAGANHEVNRRTTLQRSASSRRNLGGGKTSSLDDSSHFVTGSRIRRISIRA